MHLPAFMAVTMTEARSRAIERARRAGRLATRPVAAFRRRASFLWELRSFVRESLVAILLSLVIVTIAGVLFGSLREALLALPGLTLLVPGALAMRGNIYASMGARLGSALHTGELPSHIRGSPRLNEEILAAVVQTLVGSIFLALIGRMVAIAIGIETATIVELTVTAVVGAVAAGALVLLATVLVALNSHKRGWDPDNVTAPIISSVADLVSIPCLLGAAFLVIEMPMWLTDGLFALVIAVTLLAVLMVGRGNHQRASEVLAMSTPVLLAVSVVVLVPALVLEGLVEELVANPSILVLLPPFLALAGIMGAVLASRLSSAAHLGIITMRGGPDPFVLKNMGVIMLLSLFTFTTLGVLVHVLAVATGLGSPGLPTLLLISVGGGMVITFVVSIAAYQMTAFTFRRGDDPDNVVIPVITSTMDAIGTVLVMGLAMGLVL